MKLSEYIAWARHTDHYLHSPYYADPSSWSWKTLEPVRIPKFDLPQLPKGTEGYSSYHDEKLQRWAELTWRDLSYIKCSIQIQYPGECCYPHLDLLGEFLAKVAVKHPELLGTEHSLSNPTLDCRRMFVAMEDQVLGQRFVINNQDWKWKKGDCISMNPWTALHHTENKSDKPRALIKITAIRLPR